MKRDRTKKSVWLRPSLLAGVVLAVLGVVFLWRGFAATTTPAQSDLNHDGKVDIRDLSLLLINFGKAASTGDLNGDGKVDIVDLSMLLINFGKVVGGGLPSPANYVALGDSVASGDGIEYGWQWVPNVTNSSGGVWTATGPANPVWEPANDTRPEVQACHRSAKAYPYLVAKTLNANLYNPSCSGASMANGILGSRDFGSGVVGVAQLGSTQAGLAPPNQAYDSFKPDVVSLTLGMDDINFSDILRQCYVGFSCVTAANDQDVNARLVTFKSDLTQVLAEIQRRGTTAGKMPWVVLTTYYDPFNADSTVTCGDVDLGLGQGLSADEVSWLRSKLQLMNQTIKDTAASYPKIKVADVSTVLTGHTLCSADPWVYGISIWYSSLGNPAPFHPTPQGQAAIANVVTSVMRGL